MGFDQSLYALHLSRHRQTQQSVRLGFTSAVQMGTGECWAGAPLPSHAEFSDAIISSLLESTEACLFIEHFVHVQDSLPA